MRNRFLIASVTVCLFVLQQGQALYAQNISTDGSDIEPSTRVILVPGEELLCYAFRGGSAIGDIARHNRFLKPTLLPPGLEIHVHPAIYSVATAVPGASRLRAAISSNTREYIFRQLNPSPLYAGGPVIMPDNRESSGEQDTLCAPYPVSELWIPSFSVIRGQTMFMVVGTHEPVVCEVSYLGFSEPCYAIDETHYLVLLAVSALEKPGTYTLHFDLGLPQHSTALDLQFTVEEGKYGYQYINPPASLYALLDEAVFRQEDAFLHPYRQIRTPFRSWELPLGYPLTMQLPVSADFGDRRSYGGMLDGYHSGVDFRAWSGLPVIAPADGVVVLNQTLKARGNAILIDHGWGLVTGFWHLSSTEVETGQSVTKGQIIGNVGNTGLSTGSHLHWEMWVNGVSVDGKQWLDSANFTDLSMYLTDM
jgi:hypothetical protein